MKTPTFPQHQVSELPIGEFHPDDVRFLRVNIWVSCTLLSWACSGHTDASLIERIERLRRLVGLIEARI